MPVICGDCKEVIKRMDDNSIDSIVTDPPAGIAFMGKEWDKNKGGRDQWIEWMAEIATECLRVIKPGGHALVWSLPRTSHWTATAWENGGFEVRDKIDHIFGCLSEDTEILTINGWERYHRNIYKDIVLTYNIHDGTFAFDKPTREFIYKNEHPAYRIYSDYTDQIVSRNHRCIVERGGREVFCYSEALQCQEKIPILESLHDLPETIPNLYEGTSITKQILFERMFENWEKTKKEITDGDAESNIDHLCILRKTKMEGKFFSTWKKNILQSFVQSKTCECTGINSTQIRQNRDEISGKWFKRAIKSSMERWGNIFQNTWKLLWGEICEMPRRIYFDVEKRWLCNGTSIDNGTIAREMPYSVRSCSSYRSRSDQQCIGESSIIQKQPRTQKIRRELSKVEEIKYDGNMWCISVPSGAFVARRNGKIFITGNSGFPKSLDISKAIDSHDGKQMGWFGQWLRKWRTDNNIPQKEIAKLFPSKNGGLTGCVANWELGFNLPTIEQFNLIRDTFNLPFEYLEDIEREVIGQRKTGIGTGKGSTPIMGDGNRDITAPRTDSAKQWDGWGTALKPAHEDWILLRKPLEGTVAQNVLKWGVGGINIDGCRVGTEDIMTHGGNRESTENYRLTKKINTIHQGRFPANLIHDGSNEVLALFPNTKSGAMKHEVEAYEGESNTQFLRGRSGPSNQHGDSGSAARFFYCAKPSKSERNVGCENLPQKTAGECTDRIEGSAGLNSPRAGAGRTSGSQNDHPTVKSIALMRYLCRLITPPNGVVLDPFCGSGSTGLAAYLEGFQCIMIDKEQHFCDIAEARMKGIIKENNKN